MNKRNAIFGLLVVGLLLSVPALAGADQKKCTADTQTCLNKMASAMRSRGWVGVELDNNDKGQMVVAYVEPDSPAMQAGIQEGDIFVAFNGIEINDANSEKLMQAKQDMAVGKQVTYTIERAGCCHKAGGVKEVNITLGQIPDAVLAKWIGGHMLEHAVIEVAEY